MGGYICEQQKKIIKKNKDRSTEKRLQQFVYTDIQKENTG